MNTVVASPPTLHPRVFVVMPFRMMHTGRLKMMIQSTSRANQIEALLADEPINPVAPLRSDITEHLHQAEAIVVDLNGLNANVTYELGVARALCKEILLLKPKDVSVPKGIIGRLDCLTYGDLRQPAEQSKLSIELFKYFHGLCIRLEPEVLDSVRARTNRIIEDLKRLERRPSGIVRRQTVWYSGFLSCFALGAPEGFEVSEKSCSRILLKERDSVLNLARAGCRTVCIISPPTIGGHPPTKPAMLLPRIRTLLDFIQSQDPALDHIDWIVSPGWQKNFVIIGNISCYERFQEWTDRGEAVTLRQATQAAIRSSTAMFDFMFDRLTGLMLRAPPPSEAAERRRILRRATEEQLKQILAWLEQGTPARKGRKAWRSAR